MLNEAVRHVARDIILLNANSSLPPLHEMEHIVKVRETSLQTKTRTSDLKDLHL